MKTLIDLGNEYLLDSSAIHNPHLRLLLAVIGKPVLTGSAWLAVDKHDASAYALPRIFDADFPAAQSQPATAA